MVYAIIPIFVYTFITFMLSIIIPEANQGWSQFFFALSPVVFINRPGVFLAKIFTSNGYIALFLNCVCMAAAFYVGEILALGFKTGKQKITDRRERADNRYNTHQVAPIKNEEIKENNKQASKRQVDTSKQNKMTRGQDNVNQAPTQNSTQPPKQKRSQIHAQKKREMNLRKSQNENKNTGENN